MRVRAAFPLAWFLLTTNLLLTAAEIGNAQGQPTAEQETGADASNHSKWGTLLSANLLWRLTDQSHPNQEGSLLAFAFGVRQAPSESWSIGASAQFAIGFDDGNDRWGGKLVYSRRLDHGRSRIHWRAAPGVYLGSLDGSTSLIFPSPFLEAVLGYGSEKVSIALNATVLWERLDEVRQGYPPEVTAEGVDGPAFLMGLETTGLPVLVAGIGLVVFAAVAMSSYDL